MLRNKKQGILEISVKAEKILLCALLVFNAFIYIYFGVIYKSDIVTDETVHPMTNWTVEKDEENEFIAISNLPQDVKDNEYFYFLTREDVAVYINGELRLDYIEKRDVNNPGGNFKKFYMMVPLSQSDSNAEIRIVRSTSLKDEHVAPSGFITTRFGALDHLMNSEGISFILATIVWIFSFVVIIVSFVLRYFYKMRIDMMYGALGIFVIASWLITDSYLFPFIFGVYHVNGLASYMLCHMIPFAPAIYLNSLQHGRFRKSMSFLLITAGVHAIVWPILHFTGLVSYYSTINLMNIVLVIMAITAIVLLVYDAVKRTNIEYRYTFIGFLGFLICCTIELLRVILTTSNEPIPVAIGLGFLLVFVVIQQVDDLREITLERQRAIDMSEAKTRFLASMSHEIRTPINAILGMNEMILRENKDETVEEYSRNIRSSGKMLLMLVNDVLDFSRIEAGKLEINEKQFLVSDMLYDVISLVKERANEKSLELKTEITSEVPNRLISDEFRISQILINLINNAVKYTEKGTVTLEIGGQKGEKNDYELSIIVKDTGKGIKKEDQLHLFEAFSRADMKSNAHIEGTGLGLAIVKSIVDSMKGEVGVESEYGVGSEFWVKLPVQCIDSELLGSDFMEKRNSSITYENSCTFTAPEAKILAVDDNQSNLTIVKLFLKKNGITPDLAGSGTRAIELCREKKYDIILLDHMMPQPDGIETLHVIRNDETSLNRDTKAVVLTANAVAGSRQMYLDEGFDEYLTKPLDSKVLEDTISRLLPEEKVNIVTDADSGKSSSDDMSPIKKRLTSIEGLNYETALFHCAGDEELLEEIISDIASEYAERSVRMKKSIESKDFKSYEIDAHSIKSSMATIGLDAFSERAKQHEFACKNNDFDFILTDAEEFINEYEIICKKLRH